MYTSHQLEQILTNVPYRPRLPAHYRPAIGLIGCGGITQHHLRAYRSDGLNVTILCDLDIERAETRRAEFFPAARATTHYEEVLSDPEIEVVDIATHPAERSPLIAAALEAGKHVLSQKPFVLDLDEGVRLAELAEYRGVTLAVNQNGRWAPHFSWIRSAVAAGLIGELQSAHVGVHWDHSWCLGTPFESIDDLVLYDFAIHWFDFVQSLLGDRTADRVFAVRSRAAGQHMQPPMLASALVAFAGGQASLVFDAHARFGPLDTTYISGTTGSITSSGADLGCQTVVLHTAHGSTEIPLEGAWFDDGFRGTMGELLCAIEEQRTPQNGARGNLNSLGLCLAAVQAAHTGQPCVPGECRTVYRQL